MKYVKKPIPVDAWQIDMLEIVNQGSYPEWVHDAIQSGKVTYVKSMSSMSLVISTLEGQMTASEGDYLIKGPKGEYWFNKKDIFEEMYEEYVEPSHKPNPDSIVVEKIIDLEDGGAIITFSMDESTMKFFAQEGVRRALVESANKMIDEYEN